MIETLPQDIRNLPTYMVSTELFVCTSILLILLVLGSLVLVVVWIVRSRSHIYNYDYVPYHDFKVYREKKIEHINVEDEAVLNEEGFTASQESVYKEEIELKYKEFNRNESRILEFVCLSVVVVININAFASKILELVAFGVALLLFAVFNVARLLPHLRLLRVLFQVPLLVCYVPFFLDKSLS